MLIGPDFTPVESTQRPLDGLSGLALAIFCIVSAFCIQAVPIPLPSWLSRTLWCLLTSCRVIDKHAQQHLRSARWHFAVDLRTAPPIGVLILLAATAADGNTIRRGIIGDAHMRPYDVLVLFISLAYVSIALDGTGALESLALWVSKKAGTSGRKLFLALFFFFFLLACVVGNDPLILGGTPFLAYLNKHAGLPTPLPFIFAEFITANTGSAVLVSSNPTNVLLTGSFRLNYLTDFTKYTILPSVLAVLATLPILLLLFWTKIPTVITPVTLSPRRILVAPYSAVILTTLLIVTIAVLVGTSFASHDIQVCMITAPAGVIALGFNLVCDLLQGALKVPHASAAREMQPTDKADPTSDDRDIVISQALPEVKTPATAEHQSFTAVYLLQALRQRFPRTALTIERLPIPLLPFAICEFILVRALLELGWIRVFASGFIRACQTPVQAAFFITVVTACFLCPFAGTNIGATILIVEIIRDARFAGSEAVQQNPRILSAAVLGVAMGSNLGAFSYTFAASLAGLLWRMLLNDKGITVKQRTFATVNFAPLVVQVIIAAAIIVLEVYYFD